MCIADRLVLHRAQAEPLRGVVGRLLEPSVIEQEHLGLAVFEKKLAVIGAFEPVREMAARAAAIEAGAVEEGGGGRGHGHHPLLCSRLT
jgi:hypothetical protein